MLSLVASGDGAVLTFPLVRDEVCLGRARENDLQLPFHGVSRRHARLRVREGTPRLEDLNSKNGLIVDDVRVASCLLEPGKRVRLGRATIWIEECATADDVALPLVPEVEDRSADTASIDGRGDDGLHFFARLARDRVTEPQVIVSEARRFLRASAMRLLRADAKGSVIAGAGGAVAPEVIAHVLGRRDAAQPSIWYSGAAAVLFLPFDGRILLATFDGPPRLFPARERDFLVCIADRLRPAAAEPRPRARRAAPTRTAFVGESVAARRLREEVASLASSGEPILLIGETGTGKDVLARLLHESGPFAAGPYVPQNCAALSEDLVSSELFGTMSGVATGVTARDGYFVAADGGTLFLDEIGELPPRIQAKLLRVLEDGQVWPIGARTPRRVSLRVVLATQREPSPDGLRQDVYHRCEILRVPPLRERREDVVPLALHFLGGRGAITDGAMELLVRHHWPGNVRELRHLIERAVRIHGPGATLHEDHVHLLLAPASSTAPPLHAQREADLRRRIAAALQETDGNRSAAARRIGMSRNGLSKAMRRLGI